MKTLKATLSTVCLMISLAGSVGALTINDPGVLGTVVDAVPFGDADTVLYVNTLLGQPLSSGPTLIGTETYTRNGAPDLGSGSVSLAVHLDGGAGNASVPAGYEYVIAKYDGPNAGAVVFYLGGAAMTLPADSSTIWLNKQDNGYGLSGYVAFNSDDGSTPQVPDGGTTLTLLGFAVAGVGAVSRKSRRS